MHVHEAFVSFETALALNEIGFDWYSEYCYADRDFCSGNNPINFDTISRGDRLKWYDVYFIDEEGNEEERGICCPSLAIAQKWFREVKNIDILLQNSACGYICEISKAGNKQTHGTGIIQFNDNGDDKDSGCWTTYEAALEGGIKMAIGYIKAFK